MTLQSATCGATDVDYELFWLRPTEELSRSATPPAVNEVLT